MAHTTFNLCASQIAVEDAFDQGDAHQNAHYACNLIILKKLSWSTKNFKLIVNRLENFYLLVRPRYSYAR